jgi:hypothetical protein
VALFVVGELDCGQLLFVDEMGTHTSLAPLYGYSPRGKRAFFKLPRNRGKNTTLLASIGSKGWGLLWSWRALLAGKSSRPMWSTFWLPR